MSSEQFNRKIDEAKKLIIQLKKDIRHRAQQQKRGQTTYSIDAEIRGSLSQLNESVSKIQIIFSNFRANPKEFGLTNKEVEKRSQQFSVISNQASGIKKQYESCFVKTSRDDLLGDSPKIKPNYQAMNKQQLHSHKKKQQEDQDEALDELIGVVKNIKQGGKAINTEITEQDQLLENLGSGIDENTKNMGKTRRNMMKLLQQSSNCCLIAVIIIEIVAIFLILFLWD